MSEVISFRLNKSNKREADAFEILEAWCSRGYSVRHVMTEALLKLGNPGLEFSQNAPNSDINVILNQVTELLARIQNDRSSISTTHDEDPEQSKLADRFVLSVKKAIKPGLSLNQNISLE